MRKTMNQMRGERGAVLPLVTFVLLVLFMFAALAVDLGAAWAERRDDQSAADAAAMAAAIEIVRGAPTNAEIVAIAKDYVERNIGFPTTDPGWDTCPAPTDGFLAVDGNNCVSIKQASTLANDVLLKVVIPEQLVPTAFARVIGIENIPVSAEAIARIEANPGALGALPFALPTGLGDGVEYCLGTPPAGIARAVCDGGSTGFFGSIDSPYFGADAEPWGTIGCSDSPTNANTRLRHNTAIGIDHFLRIAPPGASPDDGEDNCDASTTNPVSVPHALFADNGALTQASEGFIGDPQFGNTSPQQPGLLRQGGGDKRDLPYGTGTVGLDNDGLWEFLIHPTDTSDACHQNNFNGSVTGTQLTTAMLNCLANGTPKFSDALLASPRFAIAPVVDLSEADLGNLATCSSAGCATNIVQFSPIFLQASWYNCPSGSSAGSCMLWTTDDAIDSEAFEPGEGSIEGCDLGGSGCANNVNAQLEGVTIITLTEDDWLPDGFDNQFNDPGGFNVFLFR